MSVFTCFASKRIIGGSLVDEERTLSGKKKIIYKDEIVLKSFI